jgi:hypothetical protein
MMQRPWAMRAAWEHVKNNWEQLERSLGIFQGIPTVVGSLEHMCDAGAKGDAERFFSARSLAGVDRTLRQSLERIDHCVATKSAQADNLAGFLGTP